MAFEQSTRQTLKPVPIVPYTPSSNQTITLPRVGYLARLHIHVNGVMTVTPGTGTATLSAKGPWPLVSRLRVKANTVTDVWNTTGYGAFLKNDVDNDVWNPDISTRSVTGVSTQVYQCGVASGANTWDFGWTIPIAINDRDMAGIVLLQLEMMTAQLSFDWNAAGGATLDFPVVLTGNATATFAGNAYVELETFAVPVNPADQPDTSLVHQVIEVQQPIAATGDQTVNLLRANIYRQVMHYIVLNGGLDTGFMDRIQFRYNNAETPYDYTRMMLLQRQRYMYKADLPAGTYVNEFSYQGIPGYGGPRDFVVGGAVAELQSIISINSGATLGSGNNYVNTISDQLVVVGRPSAQ